MLEGIAELWEMGGKFGSEVRGQFAWASRWCVSRLRVWREVVRAGGRGRVAERAPTKQLLSAADARQHDRDPQLAPTLPTPPPAKPPTRNPHQHPPRLPSPN